MGNYELKITHLCVGLGLSVLIELQYGNPVKRFVGLLDCGSIVGGQDFWEPALIKIANAAIANGYKLNYVHISHFDADHYNLLNRLGTWFNNAYKLKMGMEKIFFGCVGDKNVYAMKKIITDVFSVDEKNIYTGTASFYANTKLVYSLPSDIMSLLFVNIQLDTNLYFRICPLLFHSHLMPQDFKDLHAVDLSDKGVYINTGSSVLLVSIVEEAAGLITPKVSYVFTGDATLETIQIMKYFKNMQFGKEYKLVLISHHGAKRHVADNEGMNDYSTLQWFLGILEPKAAVVSAKCSKRVGWTHPNVDTIKAYEEKMPAIIGHSQKITSFFWNSSIRKMIVRQKTTDKRLFETFRLNPAKVGDNMRYDMCGTDQYQKIDIIAVTNQINHTGFSVTEEIR